MTSTSNNLTEDLKDKIRSLVKEVVVREHSHPSKQMIKEMPGRITMACPYCGDSTDPHKKRGNLYLSHKKLATASKGWLIFASLFFYSWWNIVYLPLILISILFNYTIANIMVDCDEVEFATVIPADHR